MRRSAACAGPGRRRCCWARRCCCWTGAGRRRPRGPDRHPRPRGRRPRRARTFARATGRPPAPERLREHRGVAPAVRGVRSRVYVPDSESDRVDVIDPRRMRVVRRFRVGALPQHVTPSYDLRRLWVDNDAGHSLTPIDPASGRPGRPVAVTDPYNLYFTPRGDRAFVVAEALQRLDFRSPRTMRLRRSPCVRCPGVDTWTSRPTGATCWPVASSAHG